MGVLYSDIYGKLSIVHQFVIRAGMLVATHTISTRIMPLVTFVSRVAHNAPRAFTHTIVYTGLYPGALSESDGRICIPWFDPVACW